VSLRLVSLTVPSDNVDNPAVPGRIQEALRDEESGPRTVDKNKLWKSVVLSTARFTLTLVRDTSDVFPPLRSTAGGLYAILEGIEVLSTSRTLCSRAHSCPSKRT
jgi:hypothetical protein